jgi:DNA-binding NarL/FixJ family response regulator
MFRRGAARETALTCVVAEPHQAMRDSLALLLEHEGYSIIGSASTAREALDLIAALRPDLAVLDLRLRDMSGIEVAREAKRLGFAGAIVIHTASTGPKLIQDALDAGIHGLAGKAVPPTPLLDAISAALAGTIYIDPAIRGSSKKPSD